MITQIKPHSHLVIDLYPKSLKLLPGPKFKVCPENTRHVDECITKEDKWSYAIPLEVVYLTPLQTWYLTFFIVMGA